MRGGKLTLANWKPQHVSGVFGVVPYQSFARRTRIGSTASLHAMPSRYGRMGKNGETRTKSRPSKLPSYPLQGMLMQGCISRSGVVVFGFPKPSPGATIQGDLVRSYSRESYNNDLAIGADVTLLETPDTLRSAFPSSTPVASLDNKTGYLNKDGGWADAGKGLKRMIDRVTQMGVTILSGKEVREIIKDENGFKTTGVRCSDGSQYGATLVISALGSWTPSTFSGLNYNGACLATG